MEASTDDGDKDDEWLDGIKEQVKQTMGSEWKERAWTPNSSRRSHGFCRQTAGTTKHRCCSCGDRQVWSFDEKTPSGDCNDRRVP